MGRPIVGILTFPNTNNYGAELQAFAPCSTVRRMGHKAELVDYRNPMVTFAETPRRPGVRVLVRHPRGSLARLLALRGLVARQRGLTPSAASTRRSGRGWTTKRTWRAATRRSSSAATRCGTPR